MSNIFDQSIYDKTALREMLAQAQQAYHDLMTGVKAVTIKRNNREVTYQQSNKHDLRLYIGELQASLSPTTSRRSSPARMVF